MSSDKAIKNIRKLEKQIAEKRKKIIELRKEGFTQQLRGDYELKNRSGNKVMLSGLFGDKEELIVIHNMGKGCPYCTMWADGLNGFLPHLQDRAAFVLVSPDPPEEQREFADSRGWTFTMLSAHESSFIEDMGFQSEDGYLPGYSTFHKSSDGTVVRTSCDEFGPGDFYNAGFHMFDMLRDGQNRWAPKFSY